MRDQHGGIFLERRGDGRHGDVLLDGGEHLQRVAHHDVELSGGEELQAVHLRAAHPDRDVETVLAIGSFGDGLVEAPVLRLCEPVVAKMIRSSGCAAALVATQASARRIRRAIPFIGRSSRGGMGGAPTL
jgi:hypothetical protein